MIEEKLKLGENQFYTTSQSNLEQLLQISQRILILNLEYLPNTFERNWTSNWSFFK